jgi:hypothetical protein
MQTDYLLKLMERVAGRITPEGWLSGRHPFAHKTGTQPAHL